MPGVNFLKDVHEQLLTFCIETLKCRFAIPNKEEDFDSTIPNLPNKSESMQLWAQRAPDKSVKLKVAFYPHLYDEKTFSPFNQILCSFLGYFH